MADRRSIVRQWQQRGGQVLGTLVRTEGSSYRRAGAHLFIGSNGEYAGSISGGCLEAEVIRKAQWMTRSGAILQRYSTLFDDTAEIPFGLGCGGVVDLLLEPVETPEAAAFLTAMAASLTGQERTVVTWLPQAGSPLMRMVLSEEAEIFFASAGLSKTEMTSIAIAHANRSSLALDGRIYLEQLKAPQRLFILGAGDDARPIVTMASLLDWRVTIADGRPHLAKKERFPEAEQTLTASSINALGIGPKDAVVVMTHSYEQDRSFLASLLAASRDARAGYIGLLGARHRSSLLISEVAELTGLTVAECCSHLRAPVGLDLGGEGPEAIALAVIAEVQAWAQGRPGYSRRLTAEDVAKQVTQSSGAQYQQPCALDLAHTQSPSQDIASQDLIHP